MDHQDPRKKCSPWSAGMDMELALRRAACPDPNEAGVKTWGISPWRWRPTALVAMSTDNKETERRIGAETAAKSPWARGGSIPPAGDKII